MKLDNDDDVTHPEDLMATTEPRRVTDLVERQPQYVTTAGNETVEVRPSIDAVGKDPIQGAAYAGDSRQLLDEVAPESIDLVVTSPPFALQRKKAYGNKSPEEYVGWFLDFAEKVYEALAEDGSLVIDIGGGWQKGKPLRSHYHFKLLSALTDDNGLLADRFGETFNLAQDFYWYNPAKLPTPAQWVTIERIRVKDAVNHVWWLSKSDAREKPDNRRVLKEYSDAQKRLIEKGHDSQSRPSEHELSDTFDEPAEDGAIRPNFRNTIDDLSTMESPAELLENLDVPEPLLEMVLEEGLTEELVQTLGAAHTEDNVLEIANTRSTTPYLEACKETDTEIHPARFPRELPKFFIQFLTELGDTVLDIFAGSNTTGQMAQQTGRKWLAFEFEEAYLEGSRYRFQEPEEIRSGPMSAPAAQSK
jgi:site-specific DNA-methyltransferase (cytosine-N4-specific)